MTTAQNMLNVYKDSSYNELLKVARRNSVNPKFVSRLNSRCYQHAFSDGSKIQIHYSQALHITKIIAI